MQTYALSILHGSDNGNFIFFSIFPSVIIALNIIWLTPFPPNRTKAALSKAAFFEFASQVLGMYSGWIQLQGAFSFQTTLDSDFKCNTRISVVGTDSRIKHLAFRNQVFFFGG